MILETTTAGSMAEGHLVVWNAGTSRAKSGGLPSAMAIPTAVQTALNLKADSSTVGVKISADTGWTANADGGAKTASIPSNSTINAMQYALNLVSAGLGDVLVSLTKKVKALETALVASKLPNA